MSLYGLSRRVVIYATVVIDRRERLDGPEASRALDRAIRVLQERAL
jgi:hypothetical protein